MQSIIKRKRVRSKRPQGPLAPWLEGFSASARQMGYARSTVSRRASLAAGFSRWLEENGIQANILTSEHPAQYLQFRAQRRLPQLGDPEALSHLLDFLRQEGVVPEEKGPDGPRTEAEHCLSDYENWLRKTRGLTEVTVDSYGRFVRDFLHRRFGDGDVVLPDLCAADVTGFVRHKAPTLHRKRAKLMTTALRSFLRYANSRIDGMPDLVAAVPVVADRPMTDVPRAISAEQVARLLSSIDRETAAGRRDLAIVLLLARLGLRSSEVAFLELDDIDWRAGSVNVCTKAGGRNEFPLPHEVGDAIAGYLRHGRPSSRSRRVFLRVRAPVRGFLGQGAIGSIIRRRLVRAGIEAPTRGTHQFRHGLATEMLRHGASLDEIGDVLGHRHPDTTRIYARVDVEALRSLALPWPGGVR